MQTMQKIQPFLWFEKGAEDAASFYVDLFDDGEITGTMRYREGWPGGVAGDVMTVSFTLAGQSFVALNGGVQPGFTFSPAISFAVACDTQEEIDRLWGALTEGGERQPCGWLVDRFGVTWQIVPRVLNEMLADEDRERADRVMRVMLTMSKLEIAPLRAAYDGAA